MVYLVNKKTWNMLGKYNNLIDAKASLESRGYSIDNFFVLEEVNMKYINRVAYIDGVCVYNNTTYWKGDLSDIINNYDEHTIDSFLGTNSKGEKEVITKERFITECTNMLNKIGRIDGRAGQIEYNMQVGKEFVSLFREECILTEFTKDSDTSPMIIFEKLTPVISMLDAGAFREAKQFLQYNRKTLIDDFLTDARIDKYIEMLDAADAIEYATDEDYFYIVPEQKA